MTRYLQPCGTPAACARHLAHGEPACADCEKAERPRLRGQWQPDTLIDHVAVRRAAHGEPVTLTRAERVEAARLIIASGGTPHEICKRLRTSGARANQLYTLITGRQFTPAVKHATRPALTGPLAGTYVPRPWPKHRPNKQRTQRIPTR